MHRFRSLISSVLISLVGLLALGPAAAQDAEAEVDPRYVWDLGDLWPELESWNRARLEVIDQASLIEARQGTLGDGGDALYEAMALVSDTIRLADRHGERPRARVRPSVT